MRWHELDTVAGAIAALLTGLSVFFALSLVIPVAGMWILGGITILAIAFFLLTKLD